MCCRQYFIFVIIMVQFWLAKSDLNQDIALDWSKSHPNIELPPLNINDTCQKYGACDFVHDIETMKFLKELLDELNRKNVKMFVNESMTVDKNVYNLCASTKIIYPYAARAEDKKWYYILNTKSHRFQGFKAHMCKFDCSQTEFTLNGSCEITFDQGYIYKEMVYLDLENKKLAIRNFEVPSCCLIQLVES